MKIYIDDVRSPPDTTRDDRFVEFCKAKGLKTAVMVFMDRIIFSMEFITDISFDHDLGDDGVATGYDLLRRTIESYLLAKKSLPNIIIHSANPVGAERMQRLLEEYNQRR